MNNYQNSAITLSLMEESAAQAQYLLTLQTLESMVEHSENDIWHKIFVNALRIYKGEYLC